MEYRAGARVAYPPAGMDSRGDGRPPGRPPGSTPAPRWATAAAFASDQIARIAEETPGRRAVVDGRRPWSFAELDARANQFGRALLVKCVPAGAAIGWLAPVRSELVEVALGSARVDVDVAIVDLDLDERALRRALTDLVGLVVAPGSVARAAAVASEIDTLNFFFVLEESGPPGASPLLAGSAPYEPSLAAYPTAPPEPDGPRLRPPRSESGSASRLTLAEPPTELALDPTVAVRPDWALDVLGVLALGGRITVPGARGS
jgi:hypothetical protein